MGSDKSQCDVGLGLKMQNPGGSSGGSGGGSGPILWTSSSNNQMSSCVGGDINDVVTGFALPRTSSAANYFNNNSFKSSAASMRSPLSFTAAQWQELERQTMIYKCMTASVPVPPELLIPISRNLSNVVASQSNRAVEYGYPSNGSDPEPWRCRRTDGKKWRCSRDVAPDQKYCERHAHKNRPRSRKPVELQAHFNNNSNIKKAHSIDTTTKSLKQRSNLYNQTAADHHLNAYTNVASAMSSYNQPRCSPDWFMKGEQAAFAVSHSSQDWQQMMQSKVGFRSDGTNYFKDMCGYKRQGEEPVNSNLGTAFGDASDDQCSLLLGPKLASLEGALDLEQTERPRDFIDAWSTTDRSNDKSAFSSTGKLPLSSLTLSMYGGDGINEEQEHPHVSLGLVDPPRDLNGLKSQLQLNWMNPGSWMSSPPGGPLAEALCLGIANNAKANSNPTSPHGCSSKNTNSKSSSEESSHGVNFK